MGDSDNEWDNLQPYLEQTAQEAGARYDRVVREFCFQAGITGSNADAVIDTGVIIVNNVELTLVPGTLTDPGMMQIIIDLGAPENGDPQAYYKSLLTTNMLMVGTGSIFAVNPDNGHGLLIGQMSMQGEHFNAVELADYLNRLTIYYDENRDKAFSHVYFEAGMILG